MDSSDLQSINSAGSSDTADNSSMITASKRDIFLSTYRRQRFTFPDPIMHYIAKNPKNAKVYQKLIKRCKYFFVKNPILVLSKLFYDDNEWGTWIKDDWKSIDINTISAKLWITDELEVFPEDVSHNSVASLIIPTIYQCDVKELSLYYQVISLNELMLLCSSVKVLALHQVTVKNDDDTVVSLEKLIEQLPQLKGINYTFTTPSNNTSKKSFKDIWKTPHLSNYDSLTLYNIPEDFDIDSFNSYMKKNSNTRLYLVFSHQISEECQIRLETVIDEIIATKNHGYKSPFINYPGMSEERFDKLLHLYSQ